MSVPLVNDVLGVNVARVYCCFYSSVHKSSPLFFFRLFVFLQLLQGLVVSGHVPICHLLLL